MRLSSCLALAVAASRSFFLSPQATQPVGRLAGEATERLPLPAGERNFGLPKVQYEAPYYLEAYQTSDVAPRALLGPVGTMALFAVIGYAVGRASPSAVAESRSRASAGVTRAGFAARRAAAPRMDVDMSVVAGVAIALGGVGGGIGLIALTENAGKRNAETKNAQICVDCQGKKVVECSICKGEGRDQFAALVKGVQDEIGDESLSDENANTVIVDDWDSGPKRVEMYKDILKSYPAKVTGESQCSLCDGRGVLVCDSCEGSGIQKRFLERFSPDDFMD